MATPRELGNLGDAAGSTAPSTIVNIDVGTFYVDGGNNRVGIATSSPNATLAVSGTANVSGNFAVGGVVTTTSAEVTVGTGQNEQKRLRFQNANRNVFYYLDNTTFGLWDVNLGSGANRWLTDASGNFTAAGNITAYSDVRLKINIHTIENALDTVNKMRGVTYDRLSDGTKQLGVIAQEVKEILPEAVLEDDQGVLSVAYGNLAGLLIEAIKELSAKVEKLENEAK